MNTVSRLLMSSAAALSSALLCPPQANTAPILDPSFGVNGVVRASFGANNNDTPRDLLIQPDGKILTAGFSATAGNAYSIAMTRHFAHGQLDSTGFGVDGQVLQSFTFRDVATAIALQDDGKIIAAGVQAVSNSSSAHISSIYRFNPDGSVDSSFAGDGEVAFRYGANLSGEFAGVKVLPNGKILAAGKSVNGFGAMRFLPDGTLDNTYSSDGQVLILLQIVGFQGSCAFPADGGILWANLTLNGGTRFALARVDSNGSFSAGFNGQPGIFAHGSNRDLRVRELPDGKILLAGNTSINGASPGPSQFSAFRFHADGTPDSTFGTDGRTDIRFSNTDRCIDMAVGDDGRILLVGSVSVGFGQVGLARLNSDGSPDTTFGPDGKLVSNLNNGLGTHYLTRVVILPDGSILGAGWDLASHGGDFFLVRYVFETTDVEESGPVPNPALLQAFPNPSRDETTLRLHLLGADAVRVEIFDVAGRTIRHLFEGTLSPGIHAIRWDGRDDAGTPAPAGIFLSRISTSEHTQTKKLLRLR